MKFSDPKQMQQLLASGVPSAEVLPPSYWRSGHLPGAHSLPLEDLESRAVELFPDRSQALVVYCASESCMSSHQAAERLARIGYTAVHVFTGGKAAWRDAGLSLEVGS